MKKIVIFYMCIISILFIISGCVNNVSNGVIISTNKQEYNINNLVSEFELIITNNEYSKIYYLSGECHNNPVIYVKVGGNWDFIDKNVAICEGMPQVSFIQPKETVKLRLGDIQKRQFDITEGLYKLKFSYSLDENLTDSHVTETIFKITI